MHQIENRNKLFEINYAYLAVIGSCVVWLNELCIIGA